MEFQNLVFIFILYLFTIKNLYAMELSINQINHLLNILLTEIELNKGNTRPDAPQPSKLIGDEPYAIFKTPLDCIQDELQNRQDNDELQPGDEDLLNLINEMIKTER